mmetsp:Transcript_41309/g.132848  ORF Transcript_41309/g.132848 Transcript_41309/m.132848 type:complete len:162 (+) Transcript_41309:71-556(+)
MTVPLHLQLVMGALNALFFVLGLRDVYFPGVALPIPDDDKLVQAYFGPLPVGECSKLAYDCYPGKMLVLSQSWGAVLATVSATKLVVAFSNPEGTFLRRNLFLLFAICDLHFAYIARGFGDYLASQSASVAPLVGGMLLEAALLLLDVGLRTRTPKKIRKK